MTVVLAAVSPSLLRLAGAGMVAAAPLTLARGGRVKASGTRIASWYDGTRRGRKLAARLQAAAIPLSPARWRTAQMLLLPPGVLWGWTVTGSLLGGLSLASLVLRAGGAVLLRARGRRRDSLLNDAAVLVARHLATELGAGAAPSAAIASLRGSAAVESRPVAAEITLRLAARMSTGQPLGEALGSVAASEPAGDGRAALLRLATVADLATGGGAGTLPLARYAEGIEARQEATAAARAVVAEVRMTAIGIPALSALIAVLLATAEPSTATATLSLPLLSVSAGCAALAVSGAVLVRQVTRL
ncbi:MAG TPA: hypothetical protein VI316_00255 [Candidatus Dormibacteraeota bacterium]